MLNIDNEKLINALLWPFSRLPDTYVVLDTETTGIFDEGGAPGIISVGIVTVINGEIDSAIELPVKPHRPVLDGAFAVHGISNEVAQSHPMFQSQWEHIRSLLYNHLVVIHNAAFDWPLLIDHIHRYNVMPPSIAGIFCSQRAAQPWAAVMGLKCSERGPSLDTLTEALGVDNLRAASGGLHGASIDATQTALVVNALRDKARIERLAQENVGLSMRAGKIFALAETVFGTKEKARRWLHASRKAFNNQSAIDIMNTEVGAQLVEEYLAKIDEGHFA